MTILKECYRVLEPGGRIRISVSDAENLIDHCLHGYMDNFADSQPREFREAKSQMLKLGLILFGSMHELESQSTLPGRTP
jgi:predicted SAM-dependent methyltransferase